MAVVWDVAYVGLAIAFSYVLYSRGRSPSRPLPPSPPKDILIGHARSIPFCKGWEVYAKWEKSYGDVIYIQAFGRSMLVLNSISAARDLLEKKSNVFSDRPYLPVIYEMGFELLLPILRYGSRFRKYRRMFHQCFGSQAIKAFKPTQDRELLKFLRNLLTKPDNFITHIHNFVSGTILAVTYGHEVVTENDPFVELVEKAVHLPVSSGNLGTTLLDIFPFMRYAPAWLPGMGVKRLFPEARHLAAELLTRPLEELKAKRHEGNAPPCLMNELLNRYEETQSTDIEYEKDIMNIGASIYSAGSDTTKSALTIFFLLMTIFPDVAKKAQKEIDCVTGKVRLPCVDDRKDLPYLSCILKELYRIQPPVPLGIPHRAIRAEEYRGWDIPEGTMAIANIWLMMRDEKIFPDPDTFLPERHMSKITTDANKNALAEVSAEATSFVAEDDPSSIVFGFGRRACPGKYFADAILWETAANVLALFDIMPHADSKTGKTEVPTLEFDSDGIIAYPKTFKCTITPRDAKWAENMTINI